MIRLSLRFRARLRAAFIGAVLLGGNAVALAQQYTISTFAGGAPPPTPAPAASVPIGPPERVTSDKAGNLYISALNSVFQLSPAGTLTVVAGNSRPGFSGDGGPATLAQLNGPQGIAVDPFGDIFIADTGNNRVRVVTADGNIQTVAGTGQPSLYPISGPATQSPLNSPGGVAVDANENIYIADSGNHLIRIVTLDGNINSFAGVTYPGFAGDTGSALLANLYDPQDVAVGSNGTVYIADTGNARIRAVTPDGLINTVAGTGSLGFAGDGGAATSASLSQPYAVSVDSKNQLYIADLGNLRIRKVDTSSNITTLAGTGFPGFTGDGKPAINATLTLPSGVTLDSTGNVYIADQWNLRLRKVDSSGNITTVAGNGGFSYSGDGGPATRAQLNTPLGVAVDPAGNLYVADSRNGVVRKVGTDHSISSIPGTSLVNPRGLVSDGAGNIYVADSLDNRVKRIGIDGSVVTIAGNGTAGFAGDGGPATNAMMNTPAGLAIDKNNNLYIADFANNRVRIVTPDGNIHTLAGSGFQNYSGDGALAVAAGLNGPLAVAVDAAGNVYIADSNNHAIREVTTDGLIHTAAGTGVPGSGGDGGPPTGAQIAAPSGLVIDPAGDLYVSDSTMRIRKIVPGLVITTIAGNGTSGYSGDNGIATLATLDGPAGLALDSSGNLYIADSINNAVRVLQPAPTAAPTLTTVTNAASNQSGSIAPGEIVVLYGTNLGPAQLTLAQTGSTGAIPAALAGTAVTFNGIPAPILYTSPTQVSAVAPFGITGASVQVSVSYFGMAAAPKTLTAASAAPGLFTVDYSGKGQAVALNQDGNVNGAADPAPRGSQLVLLATGLGQTVPAGTDGLIASTTLPSSALQPVVSIGGQAATVISSTGVAGQVAGMMQITVQVPSGIQSGKAVTVTLQVGGIPASAGVTIAVQ
jgi:uncharacterized protein (TIGR03437 family)